MREGNTMRDSATFQDEPLSSESDTNNVTILPTALSQASAIRQPRAIVASVVEAQIIPRLLATALPHAPLRVRPSLTAIAPHDIAEFTELVLSGNEMAINSYIDLFRAKGVSVETIYLDLLTGAARQLGSLWGADECNFCEVSIATWQIQKIMYDLRPAFFAEGTTKMPSGYRVLFAPIASEQHTLGTMMAAEFFRRAGWDVSSVLPTDNDELIDSVANEHLDLVGISVSGEVTLRSLAATIAAVRQASLNRHITVMVGGWVFSHQASLATQHGADFCEPDIREAIIHAEKNVSRAWGVSHRANNKYALGKTYTNNTNHQNAT
jgi:MerR family transcriptional regulator, light-induced transcriptional regulator